MLRSVMIGKIKQTQTQQIHDMTKLSCGTCLSPYTTLLHKSLPYVYCKQVSLLTPVKWPDRTSTQHSIHIPAGPLCSQHVECTAIRCHMLLSDGFRREEGEVEQVSGRLVLTCYQAFWTPHWEALQQRQYTVHIVILFPNLPLDKTHISEVRSG